MNLIFLFFSIVLSSVRNILSKGISGIKFGTKQFFLIQTCIFTSGGLVLTLVSSSSIGHISLLTVLYAVIYGILLISAQYCYTCALKTGRVGICSIVYSLGFVFPTISGCIFWQEKLTVLNTIGVFMVIPIILISGKPIKRPEKQKSSSYILPLLCAMLASGGLGIVQKMQQSSPYPEQKNMFVIISFALAGIISLILFLITRKEPQKIGKKPLYGCGIGIAFGLCNLLNTILAGRLNSAVFFPILNIGTILFSVISGVFFFKEKISKKSFTVLIMSVISIILITR